MTVYIIVGEDMSTYGVFSTEQYAKDEIKKIYKNGYFGPLEISTDEVRI